MLSQVTDWIFSQEGMTLVLGLISQVVPHQREIIYH
jgi:hypothetical protein